MSSFSSIIFNDQREGSDWSFTMGDLTFEVHESIMSLKSEIASFESFCAAVTALDRLVDNIDSNRGQMDEGVFNFVNQNNSLLNSLGITTPFSFATEDEKALAGQEVKDAATNQDAGFFTRAYETVKKFFKAIKDAIVRAWNAIFNRQKTVEEMNKETVTAVTSMSPEEVAAAVNKAPAPEGAAPATPASNNSKDMPKGKLLLNKDSVPKMLNDFKTIADSVVKIPSDPVEIFNRMLNQGSSVQAFFGNLNQPLSNLGREITVRDEFGVKVSRLQKSAHGSLYALKDGPAKSAAVKSWANKASVLEFASANGQCKMFFDIKNDIKKALDVLTNAISAFENPETGKQLAEKVKATTDKKVLFVKVGTKTANASQEQIRLLIGVGKDLSLFLGSLLSLVNECDSMITDTCQFMNHLFVKHTEQAKTAATKANAPAPAPATPPAAPKQGTPPAKPVTPAKLKQPNTPSPIAPFLNALGKENVDQQ